MTSSIFPRNYCSKIYPETEFSAKRLFAKQDILHDLIENPDTLLFVSRL